MNGTLYSGMKKWVVTGRIATPSWYYWYPLLEHQKKDMWSVYISIPRKSYDKIEEL